MMLKIQQINKLHFQLFLNIDQLFEISIIFHSSIWTFEQ